MPPLPDAVMEEYVWPWVHQMRMRDCLDRVVRAGPSLYEDLPDLVPADETWLALPAPSSPSPSPRGWSGRVSEFRRDTTAER